MLNWGRRVELRGFWFETEGFLVWNSGILGAEKEWPFCVELMCWTEGDPPSTGKLSFLIFKTVRRPQKKSRLMPFSTGCTKVPHHRQGCDLMRIINKKVQGFSNDDIILKENCNKPKSDLVAEVRQTLRARGCDLSGVFPNLTESQVYYPLNYIKI